ncbi:S1 family peptidase [Amycolatopsis jejuensis]|uniref:S1 family peptidase n=1 Tax=Amycolatopsis jejuensis TaxID=330084 RepID=UPI00052468CF|nr:S1 family peptidase [Amycolatopsis jejuensis]
MRRVIIGVLVLAGVIATAPAASAIVGGHPVEDAPWAAMVESNGEQACSGSIIAPTWVLTAKHCVAADAVLSVRVGNAEHPRGIPAKVVRAAAAPTGDDIVLLQLDRPVRTCYAKLGESPKVGATEQVYGWGYDESGKLQTRLKVASLTITSANSGLIHAKRGDGLPQPGDSGAPVFVDGLQVGVHFGSAEDTSTESNVASSRAWIRETAGV